MSTSFHQHDLDRLIDGELAEQRRSDLLRACELEPHRWREVALAFVESQALRLDLGPVPSSRDKLENRPLSQPVSVSKSPQLMTLLAVAASMMLMLGIGYQVGKVPIAVAENSVPAAPDHTSPENPRSDIEPSPEAMPSVPSPIGESVQVVMFDPESNQLRSVPVDLTPQSQLPEDFFESHRRSTEQLRKWLQYEGHKLEHEQRYVPVKLPGNRTGYIPVDSYRVRRNQYQ